MEKIIEYKHLNRSFCYWYTILLFAPIIGFFLYKYTGWWMFFACLLAYIIQICPILIICIDSDYTRDTVSIRASQMSIFVEKERNFQIFHSVIFGVAAILDLFPFFAKSSFFIGYRIYEGGIVVSTMSMIMAAVLIIVGCLAPWFSDSGCAISDIFSIEEKYKRTGLSPSELKDREIKRRRQVEEERRNDEIQRYGIGYIELDRYHQLFVNENEQILFIRGTGYRFQDILSYTVQDNSRTIHSGGISTTTTDPTSVVERAIIGDVLFGKVGAVIGGATAPKTTKYGNTYSEVIHHYKIIITVNSISSPMVTIDVGSNQVLKHKLSSILTVIISRNRTMRN